MNDWDQLDNRALAEVPPGMPEAPTSERSMTSTATAPIIHDTELAIADDVSSDKLVFVNTQHIPDDFIANLKKEKMDSARRPAGDFLHMCSIPAGVVEDLLRGGYDVTKEPVRETIRMLKLFGLDAFITSDKQI